MEVVERLPEEGADASKPQPPTSIVPTVLDLKAAEEKSHEFKCPRDVLPSLFQRRPTKVP